MTYYRYRYRYYGYRRKTKRELISEKYGGVDKDVRKVFFNLSPQTLQALFDEYAKEFGVGKRKYAEQTYQRWRQGEVRMSGVVSERLLHLLPPLLPFQEKYFLVSQLWHRLQPRLTLRIDVNPDTGVKEAVDLIVTTLESKRTSTIPDSVRGRIEWLSGEDAQLAERLVQEVQAREGAIIRDEALHQMRQILHRINGNADLQVAGRKTIEIAGTTIEITLKRASIYRRLFMGSDNSGSNENLPVLGNSKERSLSPIQNPDDIMSEAIKRLTPEQQENLMEKAATELFRLQSKRAESSLDIDIAEHKMEQLTNVARRLEGTNASFRGETEHAGTRLTVHKSRGCSFLLFFILLQGAGVFVSILFAYL